MSAKTDQLRKNISELEGEMNALNDQLELNPEDLLPSPDLLDGIQDIQIFDYDKEIKEIKKDSLETLECLSKLYLSAGDIVTKNLDVIIKNDAKDLEELEFSLFCTKRGIISVMKSIDSGITDPELFKSLSMLQKEIRDTIKMSYDLQKKMMSFYKGIRDELAEIKTVQAEFVDDNEINEIESNDDNDLNIIDFTKINQQVEAFQEQNKKKN